MNDKNYQAFANQYYRLTGETYKKLDPEGSDFMNLGLWPADSISAAQRKIYTTMAEIIKSIIGDSEPELLVELGCGWGGGVNVLLDTFNSKSYLGVNSSEQQTKYCKANFYENSKCEFQHGFYESLDLDGSKKKSVVIGIESILHCGNRKSVFSMIKKNNFDYIGLAEILLKDHETRSHKLFNPALLYAADFTEYHKLLDEHGYDLVIEEDVTKYVFAPWVKALKFLTPELTGIHKKIKQQFIESYSLLSELADAGSAKYVFIGAKRKGAF